jgi:hypothetical protein
MTDGLSHDYGEPNLDYISTWFEREEDGPFCALNLMKYRTRAIGPDGQVQERSGLEADNGYNPSAQIEAVGGRLLLQVVTDPAPPPWRRDPQDLLSTCIAIETIGR